MKSSAGVLRISRLDRLGMGLSTLCAIHCIATPFFLGLLPVLGISFVANPSFEWAMVAVIGGLAILTYVLGYRLHGRWQAFPLLAVGLIIFLLIRPIVLGWDHSHGFHDGHDHHPHHDHSHGTDLMVLWEILLTALGGAALIAGHWLNAKWSKSCKDCEMS
ncbi:MAG: MerC domain-containing protein [Verrucomicrobiota bacterium]